MKIYFKLLTPIIVLMLSASVYALPLLSSLPSAKATIFLNFSGAYVNTSMWQSGTPFTCAGSGMSDVQITEVFNRVSEDYRPFNVNITTDSTIFFAAPLNTRMRVIITPTSAWFQGAGGVAYVGSFTWSEDIPCFVFCDRLGPNNPKYVAEACSHESGHTVGLSHQSTYDLGCNLTATYNIGKGSGQVSWAPIMGNSYYRNMSGWNNGPTPYGCTNVQDNLSIITTQNGFTYRTDDYSDLMNNSTTNLFLTTAPTQGIITTSTDKDAFKFTIANNTNVYINITPFSVGANNAGADLDVKVGLYNSSKTLVAMYDPSDRMDVVIDTILVKGDYFLEVQGSGNINVTDYGSLGSYTISNLQAILPIHKIQLSGNAGNNKHLLNWNIISDEPINNIEIQTSADGNIFYTLTATSVTNTSFGYVPLSSGEIYYRLKVTSVTNQTAYSNTLALQASAVTTTSFKVSTFVQNEVTINSTKNYQYLLSDINGNLLKKGMGNQGFNKMDISNHPAGMYILQLISNNKIETERIIKQ